MNGITKFNFSFDYFERDLKYILNAIHECYLKILTEIESVNPIENDIRDVFISEKYFNNPNIREELGVKEYLFDKEIQTIKGRADIRILNMIESISGNLKPYYFIECKVLDASKPTSSKSNLYTKYKIEGINRFLDKKYETPKEANGMIGFFIKKTNIKKQCEFFEEFTFCDYIVGCENFYISEHSIDELDSIKLYHLMLDFSSKIRD